MKNDIEMFKLHKKINRVDLLNQKILEFVTKKDFSNQVDNLNKKNIEVVISDSNLILYNSHTKKFFLNIYKVKEINYWVMTSTKDDNFKLILKSKNISLESILKKFEKICQSNETLEEMINYEE